MRVETENVEKTSRTQVAQIAVLGYFFSFKERSVTLVWTNRHREQKERNQEEQGSIMPAHKRKRRERTHEWQDIQQTTLWPEQEVYERLRPIVLFGKTAASRARETGASERTLHQQARLFEQEGMASLFHKARTTERESGRSLPPDMCQMIVNLKAEYSGFSLRVFLIMS